MFLFALLLAAPPPTAVLAKHQRALMPVVVSEKTRAIGEELAAQLSRISGAHFEVVDRNVAGIVLKLAPSADPFAQEDYAITTRANGVELSGASTAALEDAIWDLLYRIGYRQFFPGETWEVVPKLDEVAVSIDVRAKPSFYSRRIWYAHGGWGYNEAPYKDWVKKNRIGGLTVPSGHAYQKIIREHAADFQAHPEWLGLVGGERKSTKLCLSNAALRSFVLAYARDQLVKNPAADGVSLEPSDGTGWCECDKCAALGSPSDRAVTLANEVAAGIGSKLVGMYAYNLHAPPPKIRVHPQVIVSVATAYAAGGWTTDQLLEGWSKQGAKLGIREYFSVNAWDRDAPGRARAASTAYVAESIARFHEKGARFFSAESGDNWGPCGLGYYLASRILWDVSEAKNARALREDFLVRAFGPAKEPMDRFYAAIDGASRPLLSDDLIARMYAALEEAKKLAAKDPAVMKRIDALVLYARYVELFQAYEVSRGADRQPAYEAVIGHAYRMRTTEMVHAKAVFKKLAKKDHAVKFPEAKTWDERPFVAQELSAMIADGKKTHARAGFNAVSFERELRALELGAKTATAAPMTTRGDTELSLVVKDPREPIVLTVASGFFGPGRTYADATVEIGDAFTTKIPQDGRDHRVEWKAPKAGTYRIAVRDRKRGARIGWPLGAKIAFAADPEHPTAFHGRWSAYFFVPQGTKIVGGFAGGAGVLLDGSGHLAAKLPTEPQHFEVKVPAGEDNKLWRFEKSAGIRILSTVPPYLFRVPEEAIAPSSSTSPSR